MPRKLAEKSGKSEKSEKNLSPRRIEYRPDFSVIQISDDTNRKVKIYER